MTDRDLDDYVEAPSMSPGEAVKLYREDAKLSLADLAEQLDVDVDRIAAWEEGETPVTPSCARDLAKIFKTGHLVFL
ncbi:MAG: helix-turn-helix domain-containing protein [Pseudodesulfovibrio sp.]